MTRSLRQTVHYKKSITAETAILGLHVLFAIEGFGRFLVRLSEGISLVGSRVILTVAYLVFMPQCWLLSFVSSSARKPLPPLEFELIDRENAARKLDRMY